MLNIPIQPAKNVFRRFPDSVRSTFLVSDRENVYSKEICEVKKNPIIDGFIIGNAKGRYQRDSSVIGLSLVELSGQNFITPFYANSKLKQGFIDCDKAVITDLKSFEDIGTGENIGLLSDIRNSDLVSKMLIGSGVSFASTYIGYEILGGLLGIGDFIEENLHIPKSVQNIGLAGIVTAYNTFNNYKSERNENYDDLVSNILNYNLK